MSSMGKTTLQSLFCDALAQLDDANFTVRFWDGSVRQFGTGNDFKLHFKSREALKRMLVDMPLGFGEGYMNGNIEVEGDLKEVVRVGLSSEKLQATTSQALFNIFKLNILQRNSRKADRQNISFHYDLGNDFYRLWLDQNLIYSCAYFQDDQDSLEQAQTQKIDLCCRKLQLHPNERLLDIGCGWGSLLINAAKNYGVQGFGITLSKEQLEYGRQQIRQEGLQDSIRLEYLDYRELTQSKESFDKVVSVGMFEHVGKANMKQFLANAQNVLRPGGLLLLHTIGKTVEEPTNSWIKKYIFPGCHIPDLGSILKNATGMGLDFIDCENMRVHYSKTLDKWRERFDRNEKRIRSMFDDRFIRMWRFYLTGCSASFLHGSMHVFQLLFSAGVRNDLPLTREWMLPDIPNGTDTFDYRN